MHWRLKISKNCAFTRHLTVNNIRRSRKIYERIAIEDRRSTPYAITQDAAKSARKLNMFAKEKKRKENATLEE